MYEATMRLATAARALIAAFAPLVEALESAHRQPWWTQGPRSVQFARSRRRGSAQRARAPAGCRLHRRRI